MIQDIAPHIYHNEYKPAAPDENSFLLYFEKDKALVKHVDGKICFPTFQDFPEFLNVQEPSGDCPWIYLFSIDDSRYYLAKTLNLSRLPEYQLETTRMFREAQPQHTAFAGITAHQLYGWYDTHRFCGRCGHSMLHSEKERMLHCPSCGFIEYPRISPAVIVGIVHNDKLLMSKYAGRTITHYALIAGFTEIGETVEETVRREVYEEVGLHVKNLHYYKSQPWSFSGSLLLGFFAELDGSDEIELDTSELACAGWFTREEAPAQPTNASLTSEMIWQFKDGKI